MNNIWIYILSSGALIAFIGFLVKLGRKSEILDYLKEKFENFDKNLKSLDGRVSNIEGRMGIGYSTATSPIRLTEKGKQILVESGAKEIIDNEEGKKKILDKILAEPKPSNAYDAQEKTKQIIEEMSDDPMFIPLKKYAFQKGMELNVILNIVSIYFRDFVLEELSFKIKDLDNH